jgi:hypothetical protein
MYLDNHHGDGRVAIWCAASPGMQEALVEGEPEHYFRPPYVGHRGWLGVHLNRGLVWKRDRRGDRGRVRDRGAEVAGGPSTRPVAAHRPDVTPALGPKTPARFR